MDQKTLVIGMIAGGILMFLLLYFLLNSGFLLLTGIIRGLHSAGVTGENGPKSLSGTESMVLPLLKKDYPDFDLEAVKAQVRQQLTGSYGENPGFTVHRIVLSDYRKDALSPALTFEAAISWSLRRKTMQKRMEIRMGLKQRKAPTKETNCPSCGAVLSGQETFCSYCGTRLSESEPEEWIFKGIREI